VRNATKASREVHRILTLLGESVDSFHPIAPKVNGSNIEFFLSKQEVKIDANNRIGSD